MNILGQSHGYNECAAIKLDNGIVCNVTCSVELHRWRAASCALYLLPLENRVQYYIRPYLMHQSAMVDSHDSKYFSRK